MLYHARCLAGCGVDVDLIGYRGTLPETIAGGETITCHFLAERSATESRTAFMWRAALRAAAQATGLARVLLGVPRPDAVLVQVPPALPAVAIVLLAARLRRSRVILDWHNLTSSMLALRLGDRHMAVRAVATYERVAARFADAHLCVSCAMQRAVARWRGTSHVHVFRDRPGDRFTRASEPRRLAWRRRAAELSGADPSSEIRLVVVPTSWGPDDDFDLLREALDRSDVLLEQRRSAPDGTEVSIVVVLTGLGPRRARYKAIFEERAARRVHASAIWLEAGDYEELLGCADLGVSVHRSASGLDLPMKICDLFGAGAPVCALDYGPCLAELVEPGANGLVFSSAAELAEQLCALLADSASAQLTRLGAGAAAAAAMRWSEGWRADAWPVLSGE